MDKQGPTKKKTRTYCIAQGTLLDVICMAAWLGGEFGREWIHVYVWLSPFTAHLKLSQKLLISYTPIQNKKFLKNKRASTTIITEDDPKD